MEGKSRCKGPEAAASGKPGRAGCWGVRSKAEGGCEVEGAGGLTSTPGIWKLIPKVIPCH